YRYAKMVIQNILENVAFWDYYYSMKTTIDIPDIAILDLINFTHAKTKREAVLTAIDSYNQQQKMIHLTMMPGTLEYFMDSEDLEVMRAQD
ncbi:MAG: hypothetical protein DRP58_01245, partial [Spirochaetes bacterium]